MTLSCLQHLSGVIQFTKRSKSKLCCFEVILTPLSCREKKIMVKMLISKLKHRNNLINLTTAMFLNSAIQNDQILTSKTVQIILTFKDQKSADTVQKQLIDLGNKIRTEIQPLSKSPKLVTSSGYKRESLLSQTNNTLFII